MIIIIIIVNFYVFFIPTRIISNIAQYEQHESNIKEQSKSFASFV